MTFSLTDIPTDRLGHVVSVEDVPVIARKYLKEWEPLRPYLGLSPQKKIEIFTSHSDYEKQKQECLDVWKETKGDEATYSALITAAEKAKDQQLADSVRAMLVSRLSTSPHSEGMLKNERVRDQRLMDRVRAVVVST